jgi:hypothetical protein
MILWAICVIFGIISLVSIPAFLGLTIKILTKVGRKFPKLADVGATFSVLLLIVAIICFVAILAYGLHNLVINI